MKSGKEDKRRIKAKDFAVFAVGSPKYEDEDEPLDGDDERGPGQEIGESVEIFWEKRSASKGHKCDYSV